MASKRPAGSADAIVGVSSHASKRPAFSTSRPSSRIGSTSNSTATGVVNNTRTVRPAAAGVRKPLSAASPNEIPTFRASNNAAINEIKASMRPPGGLVRPQSMAARSAAAMLLNSSHARTLSSSSLGGRSNGTEATQDVSSQSGLLEGSSGNIRVVVRCRGPSTKELAESTELCVATSATRGQEVQIAHSALRDNQTASSMQSTSAAASLLLPGLPNQSEAPSGRIYNFDHVFGEQADQAMLYAEVIQPILDEVLLGYNCTVFAYGQTGTGKTYTMEGDLKPSALGTFSPEAGIIPRTLHRLFHMLEDSDFTLRVSFLELYNEELRDLNVSEGASEADDTPSGSASSSPQLKIFEDATRKGGVVVQGLEETYIKDAASGIKILTRGSQRRQQASTKCNDHSSRSHSIFSITVTLKEVSSKGEDLVKVGKLNLVDLAGSENVGRSGAVMVRAREAGMINQSLLTLGRVINALVEKSSHVPYRESKLTRLLQDSLGGRTKTCIIATISPSRLNLEETMSTLDYAARAKTIRNKPEVNSRMTKAALLQTYSQEIERLKMDLLAAREMNGIFLSEESWMEISSEHEARKMELNEARKEKDIWQSRCRTTQEQFDQAMRVLNQRETEMRLANEALGEERARLRATEEELQSTQQHLSEEEYLRRAYEDERKTWKSFAEGATTDIEGLMAKINRTASVEQANEQTIRTAHAQLDNAVAKLLQNLLQFRSSHTAYKDKHEQMVKQTADRHIQALSANTTFLEEQLASLTENASSLRQRLLSQDVQLQSFLQLIESGTQELLDSYRSSQELASQTNTDILSFVEGGCTKILSEADESYLALSNSVGNLTQAVEAVLGAQEQYIRERREKEQKSLLNENAYLRAQNDALSKMVSSRRDHAKKWQGELIAAISDSLTKYNEAQDTLLKTHVGSVQESLDAAQAERAENGKARIMSLDQLQKDAALHRINVEDKTETVRKAAGTSSQIANSSISALLDTVQVHKTSVASTSSEQILDMDTRVAALQSHCETFEEARSAYRTESLAEFDGIVEETQETYRDLQIDMKECSDDLESGLDELASTTQGFSQTSTDYADSCNDLLIQTRTQLRQHLVESMRANKPTGCTPQKRPRPETLASTDNLDIFDAADRQHILDCLKVRKGNPVSETTQDEDDSRDIGSSAHESKASGPRASSKLAARKAARMSNVLRA